MFSVTVLLYLLYIVWDGEKGQIVILFIIVREDLQLDLI